MANHVDAHRLSPPAPIWKSIWGGAATGLSVLYTIILAPFAAITARLGLHKSCSFISRWWAWLIIRTCGITVEIEGLGSFGGARPRAIIAKAKPAPALVELQAEQEKLMRRIGIPPEPRKFTPHVTLARLRDASAAAVAAYLTTRGFFLSRRFEATRFVLFSSRASTGGGPYLVEAAYPLG